MRHTGHILLGLCLCLCGCKKAAEPVGAKGSIENMVAKKAIQRYEAAKKSGDMKNACVQAGFVAAAYLQARDQANHETWRAIEKKDCDAPLPF